MTFPWKTIRYLLPMLLAWIVLVGLLGWLLYIRSQASRWQDESTVREWLDESRVFRKSLPELIQEYVRILDDPYSDPLVGREAKENEIREQLRALTDPVMIYPNLLPLFPEIYRIEITFPESKGAEPIRWASTNQRPQIQQSSLRVLDYHPLGGEDKGRARILCQYHLHAYNRVQRDEKDQLFTTRVLAGIVVIGTLLALLTASLFLRRERMREVEAIEAARDLEHQENEALNQRLRAEEAERGTLEMKSQLYAGIGIMAGSYAHNIKNLLVRPNDLINRCLEEGQEEERGEMLKEVRSTLGTVTERLQEILKTVRRDPTQAELADLDLNAMLKETYATWNRICADKWKLDLVFEPAEEPLPLRGDHSHLQQAIENLLFNARDATFEMRNLVRDRARAEADPQRRKQALIEAASWRGRVTMRTRKTDEGTVLELRDNGIGMTEEVRTRCMETHFTTKRNNALYEGYNAGMGLGLSFVTTVLEQHGAKIEIESKPHEGALFRIQFPG